MKSTYQLLFVLTASMMLMLISWLWLSKAKPEVLGSAQQQIQWCLEETGSAEDCSVLISI